MNVIVVAKSLFKRLVTFSWAVLASAALAQPKLPTKIILIPVDDRPATTQFAQMIGGISDVKVITPPTEFFGRFTTPGDPEKILTWLESQDLSKVDAVVISIDMAAYGGLIASRTPDTSYEKAIQRIRRIQQLERKAPKTRFFAFSAITRVSPTALNKTRPYRDVLTKLVLAKTKAAVERRPELVAEIERLRAQLPAGAEADYVTTRNRNHMVQRELIRQAAKGVFDYLILGQDDAQPIGPHVSETAKLNSMAVNLKIRNRVYLCEGIDQHANVLVSRAILKTSQWSPRIRVVYSDDGKRNAVSDYESRQIETNLRDQILASGGEVTTFGQSFDFSLYVNTPKPRSDYFARWLEMLTNEIDQGFPVAVADINLGKTGTGDETLFSALIETGRAKKLLSYAAWNTAGNTLGTAIPSANVYLNARRLPIDPMIREINQQAFLLHRLVNDYEYHRFTRPAAYALQSQLAPGEREETYGPNFESLSKFVERDVLERLNATFKEFFQGKRFYAGTKQYEVKGITGMTAGLPWPRAYEVRIDFKLEASEVDSSAAGDRP